MALKAIDSGRAVSSVIFPQFDVNDAYQPENRALRGEKLLGASVLCNNAVANFALPWLVNPTGSGRIVVLKRATFAGVLPTSTNQTGTGSLGIKPAATAGATVPTNFGFNKDFRYTSGAFNQAGSGINVTTQGAVDEIGNYMIGVQLVPQATTTNFFYDFDNLDIVNPPGTLLPCQIRFSVLPTAAWTYTLSLQWYERVYDPAESVFPP
jgi:hypothetical protein